MKENFFKTHQNIIYLSLALVLGFLFPFFGLLAVLIIYSLNEKGTLVFTKQEKTMLYITIGIIVIYYALNLIYNYVFPPAEETALSFFLRLFII